MSIPQLKSRGNPDVACFDFTNLYSARNASRVMVRKGKLESKLACTKGAAIKLWIPWALAATMVFMLQQKANCNGMTALCATCPGNVGGLWAVFVHNKVSN